MASIGTDPNGRRRILFYTADKRKTIRLGKVDRKSAETFRSRVEKLVSVALLRGTPDDETSRWLADLPDDTHAKLAAVGLVTARERDAATLKPFLKDFLASLQVKAGTATTYKQTERALLAHFDAGRSLRSIGPKEADEWRQSMKTSGLADSTIARRVKSARQMFHLAGRWKLVAENPFADVKAGA